MNMYIPQHWGWILKLKLKGSRMHIVSGLPAKSLKKNTEIEIQFQVNTHIHIANALAQMVHLHPLSSLLSTPPIPPESVLKRGPCNFSDQRGWNGFGDSKNMFSEVKLGDFGWRTWGPWPFCAMTPQKKHLNVKPCLDSMADNPREERPMENVANSECKDFCHAEGLKTPHALGIFHQAQPLVTGPQKSSNSKWIHMEQWTDSSPSLMETPIHHQKQVYTECTHIRCEGCNPPPKCVFECIKRFGRVSWILAVVRSLFASINPPINPAIHPPKSPWETSKRPFDVHLGPIKDGIYMYLCTQNSEIRRWSAHLTIVQSLKTKNYNGPIFLMLQWLLKYQALQYS